MENASKALIIAGAILLSILIIGLGMGVYNSSKTAMGGANLDATELRAHNSQFTAYEGRQKGSEVKALFGAIQNNNTTYEDRQISVNFLTGEDEPEVPEGIEKAVYTSEDGETEMSSLMRKVKSATTYKVTLDTNGAGLITLCSIEVYKSSTGGSDAND